MYERETEREALIIGYVFQCLVAYNEHWHAQKYWEFVQLRTSHEKQPSKKKKKKIEKS